MAPILPPPSEPNAAETPVRRSVAEVALAVVSGELIPTTELALLFSHVTDVPQLAFALNVALQQNIAENPRHKAKPISAKLLNYYAYHKKETRYRTFQIAKRTPGEFRTIKAPDHGLLRLQRLLLRCLTAAFTTSHPASYRAAACSPTHCPTRATASC